MGSLALTDLPPEVMLEIFRSADSFATMNALVRSSRTFHRIWLMHANSISVAILPNCIEYYRDAECLVYAQEQAGSLVAPFAGRPRSKREKVIILVKR